MLSSHNFSFNQGVNDGAIVWLNETEVICYNMDGGDIDHYSWALTAISGVSEYTPSGWVVDPSVLVSGTNILVVEVHQAGPTSIDLTFDLGVVVEALE